MTQFRHGFAARIGALAVVGVFGTILSLSDALAQQQTGEPAKKAQSRPKPAAKESANAASGKADLVTAQRFVESGVTHLEAGRLDAAVSSLTSALQAGSLPAAQTARALHYRGVAHRQQGKPAQALSDLTSALSIRNGLTDAQRSEAFRERAAAYRDAGLPDQSEADSIKAAKATPAPASAAVATTATARETSAPAKAAGAGGGLFGSWFGGGSSTSTANPEPARTPEAPKAAVSGQTTAAWSRNVEVRAAAPAAAPPAEIRTASVAKAPPEPTAKAAKTPKGKQAAAPAPTGNLLVQIALVRSRAEAEALAGKVQQKHARSLAGRQATIDEVVLGNMGKLYRLRVGPYADANEPRALCASLKSDGLHCMAAQ